MRPTEKQRWVEIEKETATWREQKERKREQFNYPIIETLIWILFNKNVYFLANTFIFYIKVRKIQNNTFISYQLPKEIKEK